MKKKLLYVLLSMCISCMVVFLFACRGPKNPSENGDISDCGIYLNDNVITLEKYEQAELIATLENLTGTVVWESSDKNIITVVSDGNSCIVNALGEGVAVVSASLDGYQRKCSFIVTDNGYIPSLSFEGLDSKLKIKNNSQYTLSPVLTYNQFPL